MESAEKEIAPPKYKAGTLISLKLTNFMCHESFELSLGPSVNFIIGPNGSGKSALLTAIVVALGGRASTTSRAKKQNDFIMYGKNSAKIQLVLHNYSTVMDIGRAYKPDDYSKQIIVEKSLFKDGVVKLALKNQKGQKVSERKGELDDMLEFFGILINNPICILNQEISKTFLHSKKAEDKFELFMKATNLEQIENSYSDAQKKHQDWSDYNEHNKPTYKALDNEYVMCKEKTAFLKNRAKLAEKETSLNTELIWSIIKENKALNEELKARKRSLQETIEKHKAIITNKNKKIKAMQDEIEVTKVTIESLSKQEDEAKKKLDSLRAKETGIRKKGIDIKQRLNQANSDIARKQRNIQSLEKSIADIKKQFQAQNALDQDNEKRKLEIERLERELVSEQAREKSLRLHTSHLSTSMTATRTEFHSANLRVNELRGKISQNESSLRRLRIGKEQSLRKFGDQMVNIQREIDEAYKAGRFKKKPIGPLGYYIRLKDPDVAPSLQVQLGRNANAFACDNNGDMAALATIFRRCLQGKGLQPLIITRSFGRRHDSEKFRAKSQDYRTLLDCLEIEKDEVFNAILDRTSLESILYIPMYKDAENLMLNPSMIPTNTRCAYTKEASCMYPRTASGGYKCIAHNHARGELFIEGNAAEIKAREKEIEILRTELADAERSLKSLDESNRVQRNEFDKNVAECGKILANCRKMEAQLLELKTTVVVEPEELSALEKELEANLRAIDELKLVADGEDELMKDNDKDLKDLALDKSNIEKLLEDLQEKMRSCRTIIDSSDKQQYSFKNDVRTAEKQIELKTAECEELDKKVLEGLERIESSKCRVDQTQPQPENVRAKDAIMEELQKLQAQLRAEQEEERDPEEVIRTLQKRMDEIESMQFLKDYNDQNFDYSARQLRDRAEGAARLKENTTHSVTQTFSTVMRTMKMNGRLRIFLHDVVERGEVIHKARTLEMMIETNYTTPSQRPTTVMSDSNNNTPSTSRPTSHSQPPATTGSRPKRARLSRVAAGSGDEPGAQEKENGSRMNDARSLSGGERSFSTVAFVLSLWHHCSSPFKLMDEIDVFMDMVTRRVSYNALIRYAQAKEGSGQFLFFSPLELPKFDDIGLEVRVFEMPIIIRKRPYSQLSAATTQQDNPPAESQLEPDRELVTPSRVRRRA